MDQVLFNFHDTILLITIYECILLALLFTVDGHLTLTTKLFIVGFFLLNAAVPLDVLINFGAKFREYAIHNLPNWFYVFEFGYWLQGPFLLWYVRSLINPDFRLKGTDFAYILPYMLYLLHQLLVYHSMPTMMKELIQEQYDLFKESYTVLYVVFARECLRFYFGFSAANELKKYIFSQNEKSNLVPENSLPWLSLMMSGFVILWGISVVVALGLVLNIAEKFHIPVGTIGLVVNYSTCFLLGGILLTICKGSFAKEKVEKVVNPSKNKTAVQKEYLDKLEQIMRDTKPFLDANLTPEILAGQLGVSTRVLSGIINQQYHCNFFIYVNGFRIDEAKRLLIHPQHRTASILDIMYQVGFQSKATFNVMFKKLEGITPREYRKNHFGDTDEESEQDVTSAIKHS